MSFKDFQNHFNRLEICNLTPDSLTEEELREGHKKRWEMSVFEGEWVQGVTAGGCRNFLGESLYFVVYCHSKIHVFYKRTYFQITFLYLLNMCN